MTVAAGEPMSEARTGRRLTRFHIEPVGPLTPWIVPRVLTAAVGPLVSMLDVCAREGVTAETLADVLDEHGDISVSIELLRFEGAPYSRWLIRRTEAYELLLLGWLPGQGCAVHDHGGSVGGVRVIAGSLTEARYDVDADGAVRLVERRTLGAGRNGSPATEVHRLSNETRSPALSLHVYSPALTTVRCYEP
jgi:hypothetical protein